MRARVGLLFIPAALAATPEPIKNTGTIAAVEQLVARTFSGVEGFSSPFEFSIIGDEGCGNGYKPPCFAVKPKDGLIKIVGTTASELTAGLGVYLREHCNMTLGWPRGGGSRVFLPDAWPRPTVTARRNTPWSYIMNVCTHSYSLVWYSWADWEAFIDWMALSGINLFLAMTGQEEVQYRVLSAVGLEDLDIRSWFNGPALLTWSRGQNERVAAWRHASARVGEASSSWTRVERTFGSVPRRAPRRQAA